MILSVPSSIGSITLSESNTFQTRFAHLRSKIIQTPSILLNDEPITVPQAEKEGTEAFKEKLMDVFVKRNRTEEETRFLYALIKDYAFFHRFRTEDSEIESEAALYICQNLRYQSFPAGTAIFKQGDPSNGKMYLVYSGKLRVETQQMDPIVLENLKEKQNETKMMLQRMGTKANLEEENARNYLVSEMKKKFTSTRAKTTMLPPKDDKDREEASPKLKSRLTRIQETTSRDGSNNQSPNFSGAATPKYPSISPARKKIPQTEHSLSNLEASLNNSGVNSKEINSLADLIEEENQKINVGLHKAESILQIYTNASLDENKGKKVSFGGALASLKFLNKMKVARKKAKKYNDIRNIIDIVGPGGFFGEKALISNQPRSATITALSDCELLSITKEEFEIVKTWFDKKKNRVIQFIQGTFPRLEVSSATILENFYYLIEERHYKLGNIIIKEGDFGDVFYLIFDGQCHLMKKITMDETKHFKYPLSEASDLVRSSKRIMDELCLTTLGTSSFFGEEIIFRKNMTYDYTVKVASKSATILCIQKYKFWNRFPRAVHRGLKEYYHQKTELRMQQTKSLLEQKYHVIQDLDKNVEQLFKRDDIEDLFNENNNEVNGFSNRPYYSAFKSTNQGNVQFSKDLMEKMNLNQQVSKNKEEFIHKIKYEEKRIRAMREEFLPIVRCDLITGPEVKPTLDKNAYIKKRQKMIEKAKLKKNPKLKTLVSPRSEPPKSPREKALEIPLTNRTSPQMMKTAGSFFNNLTPKPPKTANSNITARSPRTPSYIRTSPSPDPIISNGSPTNRQSKFLNQDDLRSLSPRLNRLNSSNNIYSQENPYNFTLPPETGPDARPIRSNDMTKQVQTWTEAYENALKKIATEPRETQEEREKRINNYENFKLDVGSTIPLIENKYKVMKMKMNFQFANRERKPPPKPQLGEYKYDFLDKSLLERFTTDLSTPRNYQETVGSPTNSDRYMTTNRSSNADGSGTPVSFSPRALNNSSAMSLISSFEKDLLMTKTMKDGQLKTHLKNTHKLRKQLLKPPLMRTLSPVSMYDEQNS